jgi:hypothetical protein
VTDWLAAVEDRRVVPRPRRFRATGGPIVLPDATVHAVREDRNQTACGREPPRYVIGIWPLDSGEHCTLCAAIAGSVNV